MAFDVSDELFELFAAAIPTGDPWVETPGLSSESVYAAVEQIRNEPPYRPSCGTPERPHAFHPAEHERLLPFEDFPTGYFAAQEWAFCANCGMPWPLR